MGSLPESRSEAEAGWQAFDEVEKGSHKPIDAKARSQGHVELVVNYRTAGDLLKTMNVWLSLIHISEPTRPY